MEQGNELKRLGIWPAEALERLASQWITSPEQVVAIAATEGGVAALANQAGLSIQSAEALVRATKEALPTEVRERFERPADTSQFGLGARSPSGKR
jgi:hypothetical protein